MRVALMQEHGLAQLSRKVELAPEGDELRRSRRQVAKVVQPALADRDYLGCCSQRRELLQCRLVELGGVMRMNASGASETLRIAADQLDPRTRAWERAAGDQHVGDTDVR